MEHQCDKWVIGRKCPLCGWPELCTAMASRSCMVSTLVEAMPPFICSRLLLR